MGGSSWSTSTHKARASVRAKTGAPTFDHDHGIRTGKVPAKVHDRLNLFGVKIREARDSTAHPESTPVAVWFDQTGSMGGIPRVLQEKLPHLMETLLRKGYIPDPQILFGCFGDATCDPGGHIQGGQFESGLEMEDDLTKFWLVGQGGGQATESSELPIYFTARHTVTDAWEKRGRRGYLFIVTDEMSYPKVKRREVKELLGDDLEADIETVDILAECQEKWEVFHIMPGGSSYFDDPRINGYWTNLLGQNSIRVPDPAIICEAITLAIGIAEGACDLDGGTKDLVATGTDKAAAAAAKNALVPYATGRAGNSALATVEGDRVL